MPKIKGTHTAMKSGMLAAEAAFEALQAVPDERKEEVVPLDIPAYETSLKASWVWEELHAVREARPSALSPV